MKFSRTRKRLTIATLIVAAVMGVSWYRQRQYELQLVGHWIVAGQRDGSVVHYPELWLRDDGTGSGLIIGKGFSSELGDKPASRVSMMAGIQWWPSGKRINILWGQLSFWELLRFKLNRLISQSAPSGFVQYDVIEQGGATQLRLGADSMVRVPDDDSRNAQIRSSNP
jgi:hypothetical protein